MPGNRDIGIGSLILLSGLAVTVVSRANDAGGVIACGAILVGAALVVKGILGNRRRGRHRPEEAEAERLRQVADGAIRLTVAMAAADGALAGGEKVIIRAVAGDAYGRAIEDEVLAGIFRHFVSDSSALGREASALAPSLSPEEARAVLKHAAMVAYADGELSKEESRALETLAGTFSLSAASRTRAMQEAFGEIQRIVREQQPAQTVMPAGTIRHAN